MIKPANAKPQVRYLSLKTEMILLVICSEAPLEATNLPSMAPNPIIKVSSPRVFPTPVWMSFEKTGISSLLDNHNPIANKIKDIKVSNLTTETRSISTKMAMSVSIKGIFFN